MKLRLMSVATVALAMTACANTGSMTLGAEPVQPSQVQALSKVQAGFDVVQAISLAEAKTGGTATSIDVHTQGVTAVAYQIETITKTHEHQVQIDARTGAVLSSTKEYDVNVLPSVKLSLADAFAIAQTKGLVKEVSLERKATRAYYEAEVIAEHPYQMQIDANTGAILQSRIDYDD